MRMGDIPQKYYQFRESVIESNEHVYIYLEHIARHETHNFSDSGKANLRMTQTRLQRLRLLLLDKEKGGGK